MVPACEREVQRASEQQHNGDRDRSIDLGIGVVAACVEEQVAHTHHENHQRRRTRVIV